MLRNQGLILLAMGSVVAIVAASFLSTTNKQEFHIQGALHPWLHFVAFGILTALLLTSINSALIRVILVSAVIGLAFGTEFVEHLMIDAPTETIDVITDMAGVIAGWFAVSLLKSPS